jgi:1,4-dihydroxy-2-naphthoyl-CoA hydrolase
MFKHRTTLRMHDTDAAGVIYFANQFRIAHEAFEAYLASAGAGIERIIHASDYAVVIVHAEADYTAPVHVGDHLTVEVMADRIGDSSFAIAYRLIKDPDQVVGLAKTVHVSIDKKTWKKRSLPREVRAAIEKLGHP